MEFAMFCDIPFCRLDPHDMTHEQVMNSIEHIGRCVISELDRN